MRLDVCEYIDRAAVWTVCVFLCTDKEVGLKLIKLSTREKQSSRDCPLHIGILQF